MTGGHLYEPLDLYCERLSPGLWGEPVNSLTNLAFLMAFFMLVRLCLRLRADTDLWIVSVFVALVGATSLSFHLYANVLTGLLDMCFILAFILIYLRAFLRRIYGVTRWQSLVGIAFFVCFTVIIQAFLQTVGWYSISMYVSSMVLMWGFAADLLQRQHPCGLRMLGAALVFTASLVLRTLDNSLCEVIPFGTHGIWHVLNAYVLYLLTSALLHAPPRVARSEHEF